MGLAIAGVVGFVLWLGAIDAGVVRRAGRDTPPRQRISEVTYHWARQLGGTLLRERYKRRNVGACHFSSSPNGSKIEAEIADQLAGLASRVIHRYFMAAS